VNAVAAEPARRATAPRLILRGDASARLGFGHLARLCALAEAALGEGGAVDLVVGGDHRAASQFAARLGHTTGAARIHDRDDADDLVARAAALGAHAVVIDGAPIAAMLAPLLEERVRIAVVDDTGDLDDPVDWVINHNHGAEELAAGYRTRRAMLGRDYLMLRRAVIAAGRGSCAPKKRHRLRVAIAMGGSDPVGATARVLANLPPRVPLDVVVVTGPGFSAELPLANAIGIASARGHAVVRAHAPRDLPRLIGTVDAAISAAGGTVGELAYLGCPTCAYAIVDDQRRVADRLAGDGLIHGGRPLGSMSSAELVDDIAAFLHDDARRAGLREAALATADGWGATRVVSSIF
jgi:spore coat polysaccharide biosynthesis predicted glycosyltransferase SpsG